MGLEWGEQDNKHGYSWRTLISSYRYLVLGKLGVVKKNRWSTAYWIVAKISIYCCKLVTLFHSVRIYVLTY